MIVMGIDPGLATVGFGIIHSFAGNDFKPVEYGAVLTEAGMKVEDRLLEIFENVDELCKTYKPDAAAVEYLERELELGRRPLPELLERLGERGSSPSRRVFCRCREALEQGNSFSKVWSQVLEEETELDREERHVLEPLGWLLGRYDARGQSVSLMRMQQRLEPMIEQRRRKTGQQICVIRALGVTAGGFLSLTLI